MSAQPTTSKKAFIFIFITVLIDVIGLGIIIPVLPSLIQNLIGGTLSEASEYGGWLMFAYAGMQFLFSPVLGALSDQFGRRPVLLISLMGFGLDYILLGFAPNIEWLFVGRLLAGITGASFTTASAYIADLSKPEEKAQNFGLIGAAFGLGFIIGPVIGGILGKFGDRIPFFVAAGLTLLNWLYGYFILPESLKPENRRRFNWRRANPVGSLLNLRRYPVIISLLGTFILIYIAGQAPPSIWSYYTMEKFKWNEDWVGYSLGFVGLTVGIVQGYLTRKLIPKIGAQKAVFWGFSLYALGFIGFAFASQGWLMFAWMIPFALGGLGGPALQGIVSNQVPANEQGELQGALNSLVSLTSIIGPLLMTYLFKYFTDTSTGIYFPGMPFLVASVITIFSILLAIKPLSKLQKQERTLEKA